MSLDRELWNPVYCDCLATEGFRSLDYIDGSWAREM